MAALNRPTQATYEIHENVTVDTSDHEDHTFCGIMFPVKCKELLPLDHLVIRSVAVRGRLGPLTVWVSNEGHQEGQNNNNSNTHSFRLSPRYWTKIYERTHPTSFHGYCKLDLGSNSIVLRPGQVRAVYIHSTLPGDEAIVYDNRHSRRTYDDAFLSILPGRAHVSEMPFGTNPIWGWGNAWRDHREFVGRIEFGAVYKLWNPSMSVEFGSKFQKLVQTLFMCQRRFESPMSMLPDDCLFYILNMCRWDWANDTPEEMKELRSRRRQRENAAAVAEAQAQNIPAVASLPAAAAPTTLEGEAQRLCCHKKSGHDNEDEVEDAKQKSEDVDDDDDDDDSEYDPYGESRGGDDYEEDMPDEIDYEEIEEDEDEESDWEEDEYLTDNNVFVYRDEDSDNEHDAEDEAAEVERNRRAWIRRQFARIHVLRALASLDDNAVVEMDF